MEQTLPIAEFHQRFYPAFCITIHASQGKTIREKYTVWGWNETRMTTRAKYVALSRGVSADKVQIWCS